jgi:hypothetical protein
MNFNAGVRQEFKLKKKAAFNPSSTATERWSLEAPTASGL